MTGLLRRVTERSRTPPREALDLALLPWLMATAAATVLPHADALPLWLPAGSALTVAWRFRMWRKRTLASPAWLVAGLALTGAVGILVEYRTIFGREPGVALLVLLMSLKLLELRTARDAVVVVMLGYFLLLTHYFYADSIPVGLWMLATLLLATGTLVRLQAPHSGTPGETLRRASIMIMQALPIMAVLFVLFPRISGPLWGLPQDAHKAYPGLSDRMAPGSISELIQSSALAFRVQFAGALPERDRLYWRGPVMSDYDGRVWRAPPPADDPAPAIEVPPGADGNPTTTEYTLTLEPHQQRWLLALDIPVRFPPDAILTSSFSLVRRLPVRDRLRISLASATTYKAAAIESPSTLRRNLALPREINPRSRALAATWRKQTDRPRDIAAKALVLFQNDGFAYTLRPPLLGRDAVDDFLFESRRGFCEHYASSFVFLMRAAGIPARVVAGYLGGEINPVDGHLAVRQSDAHAWAEIWIPEHGWQRIDPTAHVAPNRIGQGLQAALPAGEQLPAMLRPEFDWLRTLRYRWDAIDYAWNLWVLGYNEERQRDVLRRLGLDGDWRTQIALLATITGSLVLVLAFWMSRQRPHSDPAQALWLLAGEAFAQRGIARTQSEGPKAYALRIARTNPDLGRLADRIASLYIRLRYADSPAQHRELAALCRELRALVPAWKIWSIRLWSLANR